MGNPSRSRPKHTPRVVADNRRNRIGSITAKTLQFKIVISIWPGAPFGRGPWARAPRAHRVKTELVTLLHIYRRRIIIIIIIIIYLQRRNDTQYP